MPKWGGGGGPGPILAGIGGSPAGKGRQLALTCGFGGEVAVAIDGPASRLCCLATLLHSETTPNTVRCTESP